MRKPKPLILVVEEDEELAQLICLHLENDGLQTQAYKCSPLALRFLKLNFANLLLLGVNSPAESAFDLVEQLKRNNIQIPTVFITGNSLEVSKLPRLESMGDDYITKPFGFSELVARIRTVLRRTESKLDLNLTRNVRVVDASFRFCGAVVVPQRMEIEFPSKKSEKIGRKELGILAYIHQNQGTIITRKAMVHNVWGSHANLKSRSLDQYIVKVRRLFKRHGLSLDGFQTVHGVGYICK